MTNKSNREFSVKMYKEAFELGRAEVLAKMPSYSEYVEFVKTTSDYREDYDWMKARLESGKLEALRSRVVEPNIESLVAKVEKQNADNPNLPKICTVSFRHGCWEYRDNLKLQAVSVDEILPDEEWLEQEYEKFDNDKSRTQDDPKWPEWVAGDRDYFMECAKLIRSYVTERIKGSKE